MYLLGARSNNMSTNWNESRQEKKVTLQVENFFKVNRYRPIRTKCTDDQSPESGFVDINI